MKSMRKGFTLIELLLVVVIIGILAAIAIPQFANTKEKAYVASMKSDLRNLVTAQEAYFSDKTTYASSTGALTAYSSSTGVTVTMGTVSGTGWAATAKHNGTTKTCSLWIGTVTGSGNEGEPTCT